MRPGKTTHIFQIGDRSLKFSGNFDSGNLRNVLQIAPNQYEIEPALDSYQVPVSAKAFFHFLIEGCIEGEKLKLVFRRLALLNCLKQDSKRYRPFFSTDGINYKRLEQENVDIYESFEGSVMKLNFTLTTAKIYFSFALPYSYERYLNMVRDLAESNESIHISKDVLCYSNNLNLVYMITITSPSRFTDEEEHICESTNGIILPEKHLRPPKRYCDKPVILISSRVHPGQSASSWALEGIIQFITSDHEDARLLRKNFQLVIIPMLNPDGVQEGNYRLDTRGYNLNRHYLTSDNRQPSIYCMKHLIKHYHETKRLLYYFDFHGHPAQKGSFLYGNALDELPLHVQTELFARLLTLYCPTFEEKFCIFDREQMSAKDRYDTYTKQGCARVFAFRLSNIIHSYTVQLGFHGLSQSSSGFLYQAEHYYNEGRCILSALLASCGLSKPPQPLHSLRKNLAFQICSREERFRREERNLTHKKQNVNEIVQSCYWKPIKEQHFGQILRQRKPIISKNRLRIPRRETYFVSLQSLLSEQQFIKKEVSHQFFEERQQQTSLGDTLQQERGQFQSTNLTLKLHHNANSFKSTNISSKSDMEEKIMPTRLIKLPTATFKPRNDSKVKNIMHEKLRALKRPLELRSAQQGHQQHLFSDLNIRDRTEYSSLARPSVKSGICRNKIHSLFIQAHI